MAVRFWGLELAPGKAYKLMVPDDVELQINQVCLGPDSRDSRTSTLTVKQLDDDGDDDGDEEMCVARLSVDGVDCQKLKLLFRGEEIVQFKAHGGNAVHVTGQVLVRPWLSEDADASVRVTVSGATLPATPAASSKKRAAAADQKDSAAEQKQAKKQRLAEEASQREQMKAEEEEAKAAAAAAAQAKAEKKAAAEKLQRKKEKQAAEEEKQAAAKAAAAKKEKQKAAAAAKAKPEPFIQSRKFTGAKKGYEFKKGSKGVGYYLTVLPKVTFDPRSNKKQQQKERNAKKEAGPGGYINGPGGLKYRDMVPGRGAKPKKGQNVKCKYVLRLNGPNGRVVDKSGARGFNFRVGVGEVIKGWDVGVGSMQKGGKRAMLVPPGLGYGRRGAPPDIPGNSTLYFEVELL